mmetsp:Transcript_48642/g.135939  ORF Transcript_48642/g.135939 Transcript_48642/m.135939 type:complete len:311 (-) Transcript_48642:192-1124(-)
MAKDENVHDSGAGGGFGDPDARTTCRLDTEVYPAFAPLLRACQEYAGLSGCRFQPGAFSGPELSKHRAADGEQAIVDEIPTDEPQDPFIAAKLKAAPSVEEFRRRLQAGDEELAASVDDAYRVVMTESVRNGIVATCRELLMWPPEPPPPNISTDDCTFEDTSMPLPVIAQRTYNDELRRTRDSSHAPLHQRAATASFLVDFASEAGAIAPAMSESYREMLQAFMLRVEEWTSSQQQQVKFESMPRRGSMRMGVVLLVGVAFSAAAEALRQQAKERWLAFPDSGVALNAIVLGAAVFVGYAAIRRTRRVP